MDEKSKAKQITAELNLQQFKLHRLFCTGKNVTAVFLSVQSSKSSGRVLIVDIYTTVVKILRKASMIAIPNHPQHLRGLPDDFFVAGKEPG